VGRKKAEGQAGGDKSKITAEVKMRPDKKRFHGCRMIAPAGGTYTAKSTMIQKMFLAKLRRWATTGEPSKGKEGGLSRKPTR